MSILHGPAETIAANEALEQMIVASHAVFFDVRSAGEFAVGALPHFQNVPILENEERRAVGACYKMHGQAAAIELGVSLTASLRRERVERWLAIAGDRDEIIVACWRGGLRSKFACEWLRSDSGARVYQVVGGYKEIRRELLGELDKKIPAALVITGATGARKSELLSAAPKCAVDLEHFALHRGSAFGGYFGRPQPAQATFENALLIRLREIRRAGNREILVEDESVMIGRCAVPSALKMRMNGAPTVEIVASVDDRVAHLVEEYALTPIRAGVSALQVSAGLTGDLQKLERSLGGLRTQSLAREIQTAFSDDPLNPERHRRWLQPLLTEYYDRHYTHYQEKLNRPVRFRGNFEECTAWIQERYA